MDVPSDADLSQWVLWLAISLIVVLGSVASYFIKRELDRVGDDIKSLSDDHVSREEFQSMSDTIASVQRDTRDEFAELRASMVGSINTGIDLLRKDVMERHKENRDDMKYMRERIDKLLKITQ